MTMRKQQQQRAFNEKKKIKKKASKTHSLSLSLLPFRAAPSTPRARRVPGLRDQAGDDAVEERVVVVLEPVMCRVFFFFFHSRG